MIVKLKRLIDRLRYGREEERKRKRAEKEKRRQQKFHSERWYRDERLARRHYDSYEDYVRHQSAKLERVRHRLKETEAEDFREFQRRFSLCDPLKPSRSVLCLGARLGTEVKALHSLGYFAVGVDLNPGPENPYVLPGDFHALVFADASVDAVYTNAFDHAFEPERVLAEVVRVLRPGGVFVMDQLAGFQEGFIPGEYESFHWKDRDTLNELVRRHTGFVLLGERDLGRHRRDRWYQVVFRKPA